MSTIIAIRDAGATTANDNDLYSPAKAKAANKSAYIIRFSPLLRRARQLLSATKPKLFLLLLSLCVAVFMTSHISSFMGWAPHPSPSRGAYTVVINTWKRNPPIKQTVAHYASCGGTDAIQVVWSGINPPTEILRSYLNGIVLSKSETVNKPYFRFEISFVDESRFKPIDNVRTDAIFSVDDGVIVPCSSLDFAFTVWQSAPLTMVGFVPRMHWLDNKKNGVANYKYGGWWSVWWMGTYSMVLSKAAFFHKKYLDLYTHMMLPSIEDYTARERNCEDLAMSMLVANATGAPPIWVKGKIYEIGSSGITSLKGYSKTRNKCLNDFISLYGAVPLISTNVKAVDARHEWFW